MTPFLVSRAGGYGCSSDSCSDERSAWAAGLGPLDVGGLYGLALSAPQGPERSSRLLAARAKLDLQGRLEMMDSAIRPRGRQNARAVIEAGLAWAGDAGVLLDAPAAQNEHKRQTRRVERSGIPRQRRSAAEASRALLAALIEAIGGEA